MEPGRQVLRDRVIVITLVGGFLMFATGAALMIAGPNAQGIIDLQTSIVSGKIQTGSAGLFVCVMALGLIFFTLFLALRETGERLPQSERDHRRRLMLTLLTVCVVGVVVCLIGGALVPADGATIWRVCAIAFAVFTLISVFTIVASLDS
jgi:hypothetical protein